MDKQEVDRTNVTRSKLQAALDKKDCKQLGVTQKETVMTAPDWQPIETAPRDGTTILGWFPIRLLEADRRGTVHTRHDVMVIMWRQDCPRWSGPDGGLTREPPTHWMPLPPPPSGERAARSLDAGRQRDRDRVKSLLQEAEREARSLDAGRQRDLETAKSMRQEAEREARSLDAGRQRDLETAKSMRQDDAARSK